MVVRTFSPYEPRMDMVGDILRTKREAEEFASHLADTLDEDVEVFREDYEPKIAVTWVKKGS
jgi:hypothetical protein